MSLGDGGSCGTGKFVMMGEYSRIQHHASKGHSNSCTDKCRGEIWEHQICGCVMALRERNRTECISASETLQTEILIHFMKPGIKLSEDLHVILRNYG